MKYRILTVAAAIALLSGCAQNSADDSGELSKMAFEAWATLNKTADWVETELGSYIIELDPGDIKDNPITDAESLPYLSLSYTISTLDGTISATSDELTSKRLGTWQKNHYYGPHISVRKDKGTYAGIEEILPMMGLGGHCRVAIPSWLLTNDRYSTKEKYLANNKSETKHMIYDFTVEEFILDIEEWEKDKIKNALGKDFSKAKEIKDGIWYIQDKASDAPDSVFAKDATIYINYNCRRIDGTGIDTNNADLAKDFGTYTYTGSYGPVQINWGEKAEEITMGTTKSSLVNGFKQGLFVMKPHEKGRVYMTSTDAYTSNGSGSAIPGYCPIYFELELIDKE